MTRKEFIIHGHGTVQIGGRLLEPFDAGDSTITFYADYGGCYIGHKRRLSVAAGIRNNNAIHFITGPNNLHPRVIESRTGVPLFTQSGLVPDVGIDISPQNFDMFGIHKVNKNKETLQSFHISRHQQNQIFLSDIVKLLGPAHFHVLACRAITEPINHKNAKILMFAVNKNKKSASRRKRTYISKLNKTAPASLSKTQTRASTYFRNTMTRPGSTGTRGTRVRTVSGE